MSRIKEVLISQGVPAKTVDAFVAYHLKHPEVWEEFQRVALETIDQGVRRYGAKSIMEVVRWHKMKEKKGRFKVNNIWCAYYARIFGMKYPRHSKFFEVRKVRGVTETGENHGS